MCNCIKPTAAGYLLIYSKLFKINNQATAKKIVLATINFGLNQIKL